MQAVSSSTETLGRLGDSAWRTLLTEHNQALRSGIERFNGREIQTTGDGFFALSQVRSLVSGTVRDLLSGSGLRFEDRGEFDLKGIEGPGAWLRWFVADRAEAYAGLAGLARTASKLPPPPDPCTARNRLRAL